MIRRFSQSLLQSLFIVLTAFFLTPLAAQLQVDNGMEMLVFKEGHDFERILRPGFKVIVYTTEPAQKLKGTLSIIDAKTIMVDERKVELSNIKKIKYRNQARTVAGAFFQGLGGAGGLISVILFAQLNELDEGSAGFVAVIGLLTLSASVILYGVGALLKKRSVYDSSNAWVFVIRPTSVEYD